MAISMLIIRMALNSWKSMIMGAVNHELEFWRRHASSESCFSIASSSCRKPANHVCAAPRLDVEAMASPPSSWLRPIVSSSHSSSAETVPLIAVRGSPASA
eukprot:scaffold56914_cov63-Phaeocystis_antarctica.AAC.2